MSNWDYYKVLGVRDNAEGEEIRRAYRRLVKRWHPDRHPDDAEEAAEKFREIVEAWGVLGDPEKRRLYDLRTGRTPRPDETRPEPETHSADDAGWGVVGEDPDTRVGPHYQGRMGGDHEATCGCIILLLALTSPFWVPRVVRLVYAVYEVVRRSFFE